jgi:hypothetical protein
VVGILKIYESIILGLIGCVGSGNKSVAFPECRAQGRECPRNKPCAPAWPGGHGQEVLIMYAGGKRLRQVFVLGMAASVAGCGLHRLNDGEPDFNTAALLARQPHICGAGVSPETGCTLPGLAPPPLGAMPEVDAVPSGRTSPSWFHRVFLSWFDPISETPQQGGDSTQGGSSAPAGLVTLRIPQACERADSYDLVALPPPAPKPATAPAAAAPAAAKKAGKNKPAPAANADTTPPEPHSTGYPYVKSCFYAMKSLIDDNYREYAITLVHAVDNGHLASDLTVQALTTASTVTGGATAKSVLSAIASGVNGARGYVDEDLLYNQSIALVLNQMDIDRSRLATVAMTALQQETDKDPYTVAQVYNTLLEYYWSGTFSHALDSLKASSGAAKSACKAAAYKAQIAMPATGQGPSASATSAATSTSCDSGTTTPTSSTDGSPQATTAGN